ncbi:unnamed protein product, partial [Prorocentrum cordatum]
AVTYDGGGGSDNTLGVVFYAGEVAWNRHLNLGRVALLEGDHVIYTADGDLYIVTVSNCPDAQAARFGGHGPPPPGIDPQQVYRFRAEPTDAEVAQLTAEAEQVALAECRRRAQATGNPELLVNLRPLVLPGGGAAAALAIAPAGPAVGLLRGAPVGAAAAPAAEPAGAWRAAMCEGGYRVGDEVPGHLPTAARVQSRDIHVLPDGAGLFVELVPPSRLAAFLRKAVDADARVLLIVRDAQGRRDLPWNRMVEMTRQGDFGSDWALRGPRTAAWCMRYLQREALRIEGHHEHFRQVCKLGASDWGVQEHFQLSQQIKAATCQDQLDGTNLISIEMKFRRLRTIEFAHWGKAKDAESKGVGGKMSLEEQAAFSGLSRATSSPDLIEYVRADVEKEAKLHKSLRLAREVMGLLMLKTSAVNGDVVHVASFLCPTRRIARSSIGAWAVGYPVDCGSGWARAPLQLRVAGGAYTVEQSSLGSYAPALLSLPDVSAAPVPLADVWGKGGLSKVELFVQQSLLSPSEAAARLRQDSVPVPYSGPKLRDQKCWSSFVQLLRESHLIEYALEDGMRADILFVKKKGGRLRMVADCRRSNEVLVEPDGVRLATGGAFGCLEMLDDDSELTIEGADLKDAFYHLELQEALRYAFALRPVRAGMMGVSVVGAKSVKASALLCPRLRVVPMGWSWAMWWCQWLMERVAEASGCDDASRLRVGRPAPSLSPACHLEYVDSHVSIGYDAEVVRTNVARMMQELERRGLVVTREAHLGEVDGEFSVLGWALSSTGRFSSSASRLWRARLAARALVRRGRCPGRDLERVIGHVVFIALAQREGLSIFESCFRFIQECYNREVPLWSQVGQELLAWDGVAPLLWRDLRAPWSPCVGCVDAPPRWLGACEAVWEVGAVREVGRHSERWRYGRAERLPPRRRARAAELAAEGAAGAAEGLRARLGAELPSGSSGQSLGPPLERDLSQFPEVLRRVLEKSKWQVTGRRKWDRLEGMPVLEDQYQEPAYDLGGQPRSLELEPMSNTPGLDRNLDPVEPHLEPEPSVSIPGSRVRTGKHPAAWVLGGASMPTLARRRGPASPPPALLPALRAQTPEAAPAAASLAPIQRARLGELPAGVLVLNAASVRTGAGRQACTNMPNGFGQGFEQQRRQVSAPALLDDAARDYLHKTFEEGWRQTRANRMIAAVAWRDPRFDKTGPFDLQIRALVSARRLGGAAANAPLFSATQAEVSRAWRGAIQALKLGTIGACLACQPRHSGPSRDFAATLRDLEQIRRRRRWKSWSPWQRCEKGRRPTVQIHRLPSAQRRHAAACGLAQTARRRGQPSALAPVCPTQR